MSVSSEVSPLLVYCLAVAVAVSTIVLLGLAFILYKLKYSLCSGCKGELSKINIIFLFETVCMLIHIVASTGPASHLECPAASGAQVGNTNQYISKDIFT